jgi:hypothetical protein
MSKVTNEHVYEALKRNKWVRAKAAVELGVSTFLVSRRIAVMRSRGIEVPESEYVSNRMGVIHDGDTLPEISEDDPGAAPVSIEAVKTLLKRGPATLDSISESIGCSRGQALDALDRLRQSGLNLHEHSGQWHWAKTPTPGHTRSDHQQFHADNDGWLSFGFTSDNHLGSKYERLDVLNDLYDKFAEEGIEHVFNAGNWIDGEASFNLHDLHTHGVQNQLAYLVRHYPQRKGITTYAVAGDDHEGWYAQRAGMDIGRMAENTMREAGRDDWRDMGYMEAFLDLVHPGTGRSSKLHLMHPGGGTAYAVSYTVQKIVEGYDGGEKPAVLLAGHYHKLAYALIRNVHTVQTGCTQDQTPFARKKKISYHLGGGVVRLRLNEDGAVQRFRLEIFNYFVRSYTNGRWSHSGAVAHADRGAK